MDHSGCPILSPGFGERVGRDYDGCPRFGALLFFAPNLGEWVPQVPDFGTWERELRRYLVVVGAALIASAAWVTASTADASIW